MNAPAKRLGEIRLEESEVDHYTLTTIPNADGWKKIKEAYPDGTYVLPGSSINLFVIYDYPIRNN